MQVFVYPEIRCKYEGGRWKLLLPMEEALPFSPVELGPMPLPGRLIPWIRLKDGVYTIDAALWKQCDDYFVVDAKEDRYEPSKIKDYNHQDVNFSVDGQRLSPEGDPLICCGPNNENPLNGSEVCASTLPQHESERIGVIELQPVQVETPAQKVVPIHNLKQGDDE